MGVGGIHVLQLEGNATPTGLEPLAIANGTLDISLGGLRDNLRGGVFDPILMCQHSMLHGVQLLSKLIGRAVEVVGVR